MYYLFLLHLAQVMSSPSISSFKNPVSALSSENYSSILKPWVKGKLKSRKLSKA